jgi:microsomal dipeptidase-like Zn-dependent dipeptidase
MKSYTDWPVLRSRLADQYDEDTVAGIVGENFVDFWECVEEARA